MFEYPLLFVNSIFNHLDAGLQIFMLLFDVDFFLKKKSGTLLEYLSNSLDPDQAHHSASPDLDPNC